MPYRPFLGRVRRMLSVGTDAHLAGIAEGFRSGRLRPPVQPMTDQELARAIREFQSAPVSNRTLGRLAARFDKR